MMFLDRNNEPILVLNNSIQNAVSLCVDENGEPAVYKHICENSIIGQPMSFDVLQKFAVELLASWFCGGINGLEIVHINTKFGIELPNLVLKSKNGKIYYIAVSAALYPQKSTPIDNNILLAMIKLAGKNRAIAALAEMGFMSAITFFSPKANMGDPFFINYRGLSLFESNGSENFISRIKHFFK
jgi:hypothetical protein